MALPLICPITIEQRATSTSDLAKQAAAEGAGPAAAEPSTILAQAFMQQGSLEQALRQQTAAAEEMRRKLDAREHEQRGQCCGELRPVSVAIASATPHRWVGERARMQSLVQKAHLRQNGDGSPD